MLPRHFLMDVAREAAVLLERLQAFLIAYSGERDRRFRPIVTGCTV